MNKTFKVNYLARNFEDIKNELKKYSQRYYGNAFSDLSEASINTFMIDAVSYVGDVLSYYIDYQANESFLQTAIEGNNITKLAKSLGYKPSITSTTTGKVALYILVPSDGYGSPDYSRMPIIKKGSTLNTADGTRTYVINEDIIFDENLIGTNYVVARTNSVGNPTFYAVKIYIPVISGIISIQNVVIENFQKFQKITIPDENAVEIISVVDSEGNEYYEVSNLSQNIIYESILNTDSPSSSVKYILKPISAQRRFVVEYENGIPVLIFGAKQFKPDEDLTINPVVEPTKFVLNRYNNDHLADSYFEPHKLLNGDSFGIGPENTILTITYRANTSRINSANSGEITTVNDLTTQFLKDTAASEQDIILSSVQVVNEEPIVGENLEITNQQIKDLAGIIYQAQNRAVTAKDYEALTYMMPPKFGAVKRVKAERDARSLKNNINLYVISTDGLNLLTNSSSQLKQNLKTWLTGFKMITDTVDIIDAKVINLAITYSILIDPNYDKLEVYNLVQDQLKTVFLQKPQIGQSFNKLDFYREIRKSKGVLDIADLQITSKTDLGYSNIPFNVAENTSEDGNFIIMPRNAIYEIRNVDTDIIGKIL